MIVQYKTLAVSRNSIKSFHVHQTCTLTMTFFQFPLHWARIRYGTLARFLFLGSSWSTIAWIFPLDHICSSTICSCSRHVSVNTRDFVNMHKIQNFDLVLRTMGRRSSRVCVAKAVSPASTNVSLCVLILVERCYSQLMCCVSFCFYTKSNCTLLYRSTGNYCQLLFPTTRHTTVLQDDY